MITNNSYVSRLTIYVFSFLFLVINCVFIFVPERARAASWNVDCTYFDTFDVGSSCSNGVVTLAGSGSAVYMASQTGGNFASTTYYVTLTSSGTGSFNFCFRGSCVPYATYSSGNVSESALNSAGGVPNGNAWIFIGDNGNYFNGTVSNICIDDDGTSCSGGGGGGTASTTAATTTVEALLGGVIFGQAILIFMVALGLFGFLGNNLFKLGH